MQQLHLSSLPSKKLESTVSTTSSTVPSSSSSSLPPTPIFTSHHEHFTVLHATEMHQESSNELMLVVYRSSLSEPVPYSLFWPISTSHKIPELSSPTLSTWFPCSVLKPGFQFSSHTSSSSKLDEHKVFQTLQCRTLHHSELLDHTVLWHYASSLVSQRTLTSSPTRNHMETSITRTSSLDTLEFQSILLCCSVTRSSKRRRLSRPMKLISTLARTSSIVKKRSFWLLKLQEMLSMVVTKRDGSTRPSSRGSSRCEERYIGTTLRIAIMSIHISHNCL